MGKTAGRLCVIKKNDVAIGGFRTTGMTVNASPIDVTDRDDGGFQTFLAGTLTGRSIQLTGDGYEEDQVIRDIALATSATGHFMTDLTFEFPNGDKISGDFVLTGYSETGAYQDGQTFSCTFSSDAAWTYTQAA